MKHIRQLNLFFSCPGDISDEIDSINLIINEINKTSGRQNNFNIQIVHWDEDTYTQIGEDGQDVINNQIKYDILVGILWLRIGTPTKRDKSGTIEEINRAVSNEKKEQLIYFKTTPLENLNLINTEELNKINSYKEDLKNKGVLYKEFNSISKFETLFRLNLSNLIIDKFLSNTSPSVIEKSNLAEIKDIKYPEILSLIDEVENPTHDSMEVDIFSLQEEGISSLNSVTNCLNSLTDNSTILGENLNKRTKEINIINNIKDNRLRLSKTKTVISLLSKELDEFNEKTDFETPILAENLTAVGNSLSKWIIASYSYDKDDKQSLRTNALSFRDSLQYAMESVAELLRTIMDTPVINQRFNKSKRETEISIKNLTKEIMHGLILIDEALKN